MDLPIQDLMDETACSQDLLDVLHPEDHRCPRCQAREGFQVHRSSREPVFDDRCPTCGRAFNAWTGTVFQGTHSRPSVLVLTRRHIGGMKKHDVADGRTVVGVPARPLTPKSR